MRITFAPVLKHSVLILLFLFSATLFAQHNQLRTKLSEFIQGKKAEIGIAVILNGQDTVTVNNNARYPLMSVFKFHQALALADYLNRNNIPLDTKLPIKAEDLMPDTYSPLRDNYPQGGIEMTIADLLKYTLQQSDNNACDILFSYQGGVKAADDYIRSLGIDSCAIAFTENDMHQQVERSYQNWTSPLAAARLLEVFLHRPLFGNAYKDFIYQTMVECKTGTDRLPAPLTGKGVTIGHKTGTGDLNGKGQMIACNDIGFVILPDGGNYSIAVFVKDSEGNMKANSQIIADISQIVYEYMTDISN